MIQISPKVKDALEWAACIVIAVILALVIKYYLGTPTVVENTSMVPTLQDGQRLWLDRTVRTFGKEINRGDIVTVEAPYVPRVEDYDGQSPAIAQYNEPSSAVEGFFYYVFEIGKTSYIKRVIGLPGEHIKIENGNVYINDEVLEEDYLPNGLKTERLGVFYDLVVPEGTLFLMGDNRSKSMDSRSFGCVPIGKIESRVGFRFWPLNLFGGVK